MNWKLFWIVVLAMGAGAGMGSGVTALAQDPCPTTLTVTEAIPVTVEGELPITLNVTCKLDMPPWPEGMTTPPAPPRCPTIELKPAAEEADNRSRWERSLDWTQANLRVGVGLHRDRVMSIDEGRHNKWFGNDSLLVMDTDWKMVGVLEVETKWADFPLIIGEDEFIIGAAFKIGP